MLKTAELRGWMDRTGTIPAPLRAPRVREAVRLVVGLLAALCVFGVLLLLQSKNPFIAYRDIYKSAFGSSFGFSEMLVKFIPLLLCALAVAIPARVGLVNVGGEGQLYFGALFAGWGALTFTGLSRPMLLALMLLLAIAGGALWAGIAAVLRALGWLNETISTLLMNYVAILIVQYFVFGPWKDPRSGNFPQSRPFVPAAALPTFGSNRVHLGIVFALVAVAVMWFVLRRTRWGYEMRAIGGNPEAARRAGIPLRRYILITLMVGGAMAAIAGFGEISAIQGRVRPTISPGYGYIGFLVSWLAGHNPIGVVVMALLLAVIAAGGDSLQISQGLPFSSVNLLMSLTLFMVLAQRSRTVVDR
jgi:simple sugar transport system permease protein